MDREQRRVVRVGVLVEQLQLAPVQLPLQLLQFRRQLLGLPLALSDQVRQLDRVGGALGQRGEVVELGAEAAQLLGVALGPAGVVPGARLAQAELQTLRPLRLAGEVKDAP